MQQKANAFYRQVLVDHSNASFDFGTFQDGWTALHTTCFIQAVLFHSGFYKALGDIRAILILSVCACAPWSHRFFERCRWPDSWSVCWPTTGTPVIGCSGSLDGDPCT